MINQIAPFLTQEVELITNLDNLKLGDLLRIKENNPSLYNRIKRVFNR